MYLACYSRARICFAARGMYTHTHARKRIGTDTDTNTQPKATRNQVEKL
jgi:hypothetical protein